MPGTFEDLQVWQFGMALVYDVYDLTRHFPPDERFGLVTQMRRAAVSIPSNIAEGKGRSTDKDFALFLSHARGSQQELHTADSDRETPRISRRGRSRKTVRTNSANWPNAARSHSKHAYVSKGFCRSARIPSGSRPSLRPEPYALSPTRTAARPPGPAWRLSMPDRGRRTIPRSSTWPRPARLPRRARWKAAWAWSG